MAKQTTIIFRDERGRGIAKYVGPKGSAVDARSTARMIMAEGSTDERGLECCVGVTYYRAGKRLHEKAGVDTVSINGHKYSVDRYIYGVDPLGYTG